MTLYVALHSRLSSRALATAMGKKGLERLTEEERARKLRAMRERAEREVLELLMQPANRERLRQAVAAMQRGQAAPEPEPEPEG